MAKPATDVLVRLDLNNPVFQENLLDLQKPERHSALETLKKLRQMTWNQVYIDNGLKWEKMRQHYAPCWGLRHIFLTHYTIPASDRLQGGGLYKAPDDRARSRCNLRQKIDRSMICASSQISALGIAFYG